MPIVEERRPSEEDETDPELSEGETPLRCLTMMKVLMMLAMITLKFSIKTIPEKIDQNSR